MEFYDDPIDSSHIQTFMVQSWSCLLLRGGPENQSEGTPLPSGGGLLIRCWHYIYIDTTHSTSELCFLKAFSAQSWRFAGQGSKGSAPKEKERHHDHRSGGC